MYQRITVSGGYLPVLTVPTVEVASQRPQRKTERTGEKMKQRFLFNGISRYRRCPAVIHVEEDTLLVLVHTANAELARINPTTPLAGMTLYPRAR